LKNKTILILSPQSWGKMFISKHHYAVELAKRGNKVFFLNPPDQVVTTRKESIVINASGVHENLFLINHRLFFPYTLKYHAVSVFHWLMQFHIKKVIKTIKQPIDIIWSFDIGNLYPFRFFDRRAYRIFHPVDEPLNPAAVEAAKGADIIFSVTQEILEKYASLGIPKHFINHGVSEDFLLPVPVNGTHTCQGPLQIGFSGNLLRPDIDKDILLQLVRDNGDHMFNFWGSYTLESTNIGGRMDIATVSFIKALQQQQNVVLHGVVSPHQLAKEIRKMDAFLICYDVQKDQSKGTNYHKLLEYVSTGKVIISNNITTYRDKPFLVQMVPEREHNKSLPALFKKVMREISLFNTPELQQQRAAFAAENAYIKQLDRIEKIIDVEKLNKLYN
jgi:hypothetical protein